MGKYSGDTRRTPYDATIPLTPPIRSPFVCHPALLCVIGATGSSLSCKEDLPTRPGFRLESQLLQHLPV